PTTRSITCTETPATYPLSLHDALPISRPAPRWRRRPRAAQPQARAARVRRGAGGSLSWAEASGDSTRRVPGILFSGIYRSLRTRSEEHTSELQSRENLVCRLLLEKKNI